MTSYTYHGPLSALTLPDGTEVALYPGKTVSLPAANACVAQLVTLGYLTA